jgi:pimeloyl-ACP methyl ester carboxylesterase
VSTSRVETASDDATSADETSAIEGRSVEVAGLTIRTSERGVGGPPFVVLHHSTGPLWTPFHDALAERRAVLAPDLPGYGRSDRPDDARSPRDLGILWLRALDELEPDPVHLVGLGMGGWVAAEIATMAVRRLASLTLVGAAGIKPRQGFIHDPMMSSWTDYARVGFHDPARFDAVIGDDPPESLLELWDFSREMTARLTWKPWMWSVTLPSLLRGVRTPALVVHGRHDRVVPLDCAEQYRDLLADARLEVVEDVGHLIDLEQPQRLADLLVDFAESTTGPVAAAATSPARTTRG